jgi:hypothetical protein
MLAHFRRVLGSHVHSGTIASAKLDRAGLARSRHVAALPCSRSCQHAIGLQILQWLDQHFVADALDQALELAHPESFAFDAAAIGPEIISKTLADAAKANILFLAVRFESYQDVAKALPPWKGKTIIDVTNAYGVSPEDWEDSLLPSSWRRPSLSSYV